MIAPSNIVGRQNLLAVKLSYCSRIENAGETKWCGGWLKVIVLIPWYRGGLHWILIECWFEDRQTSSQTWGIVLQRQLLWGKRENQYKCPAWWVKTRALSRGAVHTFKMDYITMKLYFSVSLVCFGSCACTNSCVGRVVLGYQGWRFFVGNWFP